VRILPRNNIALVLAALHTLTVRPIANYWLFLLKWSTR